MIEAGLFDAALNKIDLVREALFGLGQSIVQVGDALATRVLQSHPFEIALDPLSRIQLQHIA